jgi:anti-sigma-K factor RskA
MSISQNPDAVNMCEAVQNLIPEYAFGLTTPEETQLVEANLEYCPEAAAHLAEYRSLQDEMRAGVAMVEPPRGLEERLMAAVAKPAETTKPARKIHVAWWAAAAATVALIVTNLYWLTRTDAPPPARDDSSPVLVQGDSSFVLAGSQEIRWVRLPPSQQNMNASAVLMWNVESETGLLYVRGFPELSAGKTFQLWLTRNGERVSVGTFEVDADGTGALLFHSAEPIDNFAWAWITEEPENGSTQPGDAIVVVGEL